MQDTIATALDFGPLPADVQAFYAAEIDRLMPDSTLGNNAFYFESGVVSHSAPKQLSQFRDAQWLDQLTDFSSSVVDFKATVGRRNFESAAFCFEYGSLPLSRHRGARLGRR